MLAAWRRIGRCTVRTRRKTFCPPPAQGQKVAAQAAHPSAWTIIRAARLIVHGLMASGRMLARRASPDGVSPYCGTRHPIYPGARRAVRSKTGFPRQFPPLHSSFRHPLSDKLNLGKGGKLLGANPFGAFSNAALARVPFPCACCAPRPKRVARTTPPLSQTPNPHGRCLTPHARGRAPGCVAPGLLWGQGRLRPGSLRRHGPASLHGCGHSLRVSGKTQRLRPFLYEREARSDQIPGAHTPEQKVRAGRCAPPGGGPTLHNGWRLARVNWTRCTRHPVGARWGRRYATPWCEDPSTLF
jgi:hypothetical protein